MDGYGYKHFSHAHNLSIHQAHEAPKMSCTGCHSSVTGTIYVCWQCNFVLHEQCFGASRSLTHTLHPSHPLTLHPYPTYPSASFICSSCELTGSGLSYSCSDCDFDLHVHCAYPTSATSYGQNGAQSDVYAPTGAHNPNTNHQYSSVAPTTPEEVSAYEREEIEKMKQEVEAKREQYRREALNRQFALDYLI